jgi:hypothetical protein
MSTSRKEMEFQTGAETVTKTRRMRALMQQRRPGMAGAAGIADTRREGRQVAVGEGESGERVGLAGVAHSWSYVTVVVCESFVVVVCDGEDASRWWGGTNVDSNVWPYF